MRETMPSIRCSVAIHSLNRRAFLAQALESLDGVDAPDLEIIVADSGSTDGSRHLVRERYPDVKLIELPEDRGLAAGRNAAIRMAQGDHVLVMDEDVAVTPAQIMELVAVMRAHPRAGIVTCCKVDRDGRALYRHHVPAPSILNLPFFIVLEWSIQETLRALKAFLNIGDERPHEQEAIVEIPFIGGAFMLVRREAIREVGLLDENIFFYGEDFDWCYRFRQYGWKILYLPQVKVQAHRGTNSTRTRRASLIALQSRRYLFTKHVGRAYLPVYVAAALLGLLPRAAYYGFRRMRGADGDDIPLSRWLWYAVRIIVGKPPSLRLQGRDARTVASGAG